jgi:hypothetical protein
MAFAVFGIHLALAAWVSGWRAASMVVTFLTLTMTLGGTGGGNGVRVGHIRLWIPEIGSGILARLR